MAESQESRRGFLKIATMALGGVVGAVLTVPLVRYLLYPVGRKVVSDSAEGIDILDEKALKPGEPPVQVRVIANNAQNAWNVADETPLGSAWLRKTEDGEVVALSANCPHLGCAINFDAEANQYKCPCHKSAFELDGSKITGPSKRGLDSLPLTVEDGRIKLTWERYIADIPEKKRA